MRAPRRTGSPRVQLSSNHHLKSLRS